jgi:hypothetical protein
MNNTKYGNHENFMKWTLTSEKRKKETKNKNNGEIRQYTAEMLLVFSWGRGREVWH